MKRSNFHTREFRICKILSKIMQVQLNSIGRIIYLLLIYHDHFQLQPLNPPRNQVTNRDFKT